MIQKRVPPQFTGAVQLCLAMGKLNIPAWWRRVTKRLRNWWQKQTLLHAALLLGLAVLLDWFGSKGEHAFRAADWVRERRR